MRRAFLRTELADPRSLVPADTSCLPRPVLCIVVDAEEDFDWNAPFSRRNHAVVSLQGLRHGHALFRRYGLQPTYLLDFPVISDPHAGEILGPWIEAGEALAGAQLHPWVTPPFEEVVCPLNSYACNLAPDLERRKLGLLSGRIAGVLGQPPRVYKAGRYGIDLRRERTLHALGYMVDTSVMPFRDYSGNGGGPDFFGYPDRPFWTGAERRVLYLPVTQSLIGPLRGLAGGGADRALFSAGAERLHLPGLLARMRLLERIMLTPEGVSLAEMRRLTSGLLAAGYRVFALSMHSPSFMPGSTPYVRSATDLAALLGRIEAFLDFFLGTVGGEPINILALRWQLQGDLGGAPPSSRETPAPAIPARGATGQN